MFLNVNAKGVRAFQSGKRVVLNREVGIYLDLDLTKM